MDTIKDLYHGKNVKLSTIDSYDRRLRMLNNKEPIDNFSFLYDYDVIIDKLNKYKPNTQRNFIIAIVSVLKHVPSMTSMYSKYSKLMDLYNKELKTSNIRSVTQVNNWITQDKVMEVYNLLYNNIYPLIISKSIIAEPTWNKITQLIVLSLYVLQPPRRIADYINMYIVKKLPIVMDKSMNYLWLINPDNAVFYFNNYKTSGTYSTQSVEVSTELLNLINSYIKRHPIKLTTQNNIPLLCSIDGSPFTRGNIITRILNKIFGLKISVSMLRNIYLTSKFAPQTLEMDETAHDMGTSTGTIQNSYIKKDI